MIPQKKFVSKPENGVVIADVNDSGKHDVGDLIAMPCIPFPIWCDEIF